ncbi:kinase-like protein [Rhizophagus irregularis]|uniref:Kinase-like protein n=1 Tax=Rhizophagus irregularis TaxID=588596 RepID=A0A2N1N7M8_9GLOM|nr:kinase-like protein [Rhizophagus irregularis]
MKIVKYFILVILGFVDRPMFPEVLSGKETTFKSDIYSIGMLMWEISSGQPPFINFDHDFDLALKIINGMRPKIVPGTPPEYKELIEQCWDADPSKRPDISHLDNKIFEINKLYHQNNNDEQLDVLNISDVNISINSVNSLISSFSKIHIFGEMPEPRNFTEEEREAYYSNQQDFVIPDSRYIFGHQTENNDSTGEKFKKIKLSEDEETQFDNKGEFNYIREHYITNTTNDDMNIDDGDDTYNNPNLHSEEQDELEIFED